MHREIRIWNWIWNFTEAGYYEKAEPTGTEGEDVFWSVMVYSFDEDGNLLLEEDAMSNDFNTEEEARAFMLMCKQNNPDLIVVES